MTDNTTFVIAAVLVGISFPFLAVIFMFYTRYVWRWRYTKVIPFSNQFYLLIDKKSPVIKIQSNRLVRNAIAIVFPILWLGLIIVSGQISPANSNLGATSSSQQTTPPLLNLSAVCVSLVIIAIPLLICAYTLLISIGREKISIDPTQQQIIAKRRKQHLIIPFDTIASVDVEVSPSPKGSSADVGYVTLNRKTEPPLIIGIIKASDGDFQKRSSETQALLRQAINI